MKTAVQYALGGVLLIVFLGTFRSDIFRGLQTISFSVGFVVQCFLVWTFLYAAQSALSQNAYRLFGVHVCFRDLFSLHVISSLLSLVLPMGLSTLVKACYLRLRYAIRVIKFSKVQILMAAAIYYVYFAAFVSALTYELSSNVVVSVLVFSAMLLLFPLGYTSVRTFMWRSLPLFNWRIFFFSLLNDVLYTLLLGTVVYATVASKVSTSGLIVLAGIVQFSTIINLTPGNLGLREWVMAISSPLASITAGEGATVSVVLRLVTVLSMLLWYPFAYKVLFVDAEIRFSALFRQPAQSPATALPSQRSEAA